MQEKFFQVAQNYYPIAWVNTVYTNWYLNDMKASKTKLRQLQHHCYVWTMRSKTWKTQFSSIKKPREGFQEQAEKK